MLTFDFAFSTKHRTRTFIRRLYRRPRIMGMYQRPGLFRKIIIVRKMRSASSPKADLCSQIIREANLFSDLMHEITSENQDITFKRRRLATENSMERALAVSN